MKPFVARSPSCLKGVVSLPGDKSIAHRSIIISAICHDITRIENFPANKDCLATLNALKKLGIRIIYRPGSQPDSLNLTVYGKGPNGFRKPKGVIFAGDSGTTLRVLLGVLAGQDFQTKLVAGKSLSQRPMLRVAVPLRLMGVKVYGHRTTVEGRLEEFPPITIKGRALKSIDYRMPISSAQVKSAILLAGLYVKGKTRIIEPVCTRDHTERMLRLFKAKIKSVRNTITLEGRTKLVSPQNIYLPGDISSAAFFMVMAAIVPHSHILIKKVSLNSTRIGVIRILRRMGADIKVTKSPSHQVTSEPMGDLIVKSSLLKGTVVRKDEIPSLIDELPILMVAASLAKGRTVFQGVGELRVKETDRVKSVTENLIKMRASIEVVKSGKSENIIITGVKELHGARVKSFGDHRTAMSMIVAGLSTKSPTYIDDISCISKSFPNFIPVLKNLMR